MQLQYSAHQPNLAFIERAALGAAATGFAMSFVLLFTAGTHFASTAHPSSPLEAFSAFLWPGSLLMLGAHSAQGQVVLFLISAFLNAGYYSFATLLACAITEKFRAQLPARIPVTVSVPRVHPAAGIAERMTATRPVA
jgi:hypothetical protein